MTRLTAACIVAAIAAPAFAQLGPLAPPPGPIADTGPHLGEIEPRTPVTQDNTPGTENVGFIIDEPGHYFLIGDESVEEGMSGIRITASDVTLDLNGFTLSTPSQVVFANGIAFSLAQSNITIRNGTLRNFGDGGITVPNNSLVENVQLIDCDLTGIDAGDNSVVRNCRVSGNAGPIQIHGIRVGADSTVESCTILLSDGSGITAGARCMIVGNRVVDTQSNGIEAGVRSRIVENSVDLTAQNGIVTNNVNLVRGNIVTNATMFGIVVNGDCTIDQNAIQDCEDSAFNILADFNKITRNDVSLSGDGNVPLGDPNSYIQGDATELDNSFIGPANDLMSPWTNVVD